MHPGPCAQAGRDIYPSTCHSLSEKRACWRKRLFMHCPINQPVHTSIHFDILSSHWVCDIHSPREAPCQGCADPPQSATFEAIPTKSIPHSSTQLHFYSKKHSANASTDLIARATAPRRKYINPSRQPQIQVRGAMIV